MQFVALSGNRIATNEKSAIMSVKIYDMNKPYKEKAIREYEGNGGSKDSMLYIREKELLIFRGTAAILIISMKTYQCITSIGGSMILQYSFR